MTYYSPTFLGYVFIINNTLNELGITLNATPLPLYPVFLLVVPELADDGFHVPELSPPRAARVFV